MSRSSPFPSGLLSTAGPRWRWYHSGAKRNFIKPWPARVLSNDQAIRVNPRSEINGAVLLVSRSEPQRKFQMFVDRCEIKQVGSIAYRLAKVAGGGGDGTLTFARSTNGIFAPACSWSKRPAGLCSTVTASQ